MWMRRIQGAKRSSEATHQATSPQSPKRVASAAAFCSAASAPSTRARLRACAGSEPSTQVMTASIASISVRAGAAPRLLAEDDARAALVAEVGPGPLDQHDEPVAEADQEEQVHGQPEPPGQDTGQAQAAVLDHGGHAADGGQ